MIHLQRPFAEDTAVTAPQQSKDEIMQHVQDAIEDVLGCRVETTAPLIQVILVVSTLYFSSFLLPRCIPLDLVLLIRVKNSTS